MNGWVPMLQTVLAF